MSRGKSFLAVRIIIEMILKAKDYVSEEEENPTLVKETLH